MSEILSGIYKIYCKDTNKYYIGQSVNVKNRLNQHLSELKNNKHINQELQEDFNACGEDAFIFDKIKDVEEQFLNVFEKYYMEYYNSLEDGYNVIPMNNLIRDKYKNINNIDILKNIDPIEVPLRIGDIYAYELLFRLEFLNEDINDADTSISNDIDETINVINTYVNKRHFNFLKETMDVIELEIRRKFNKLGIVSVDYMDIENIHELLKTKIFKVEVRVGNEYIPIDIKCTK